MFYHAYEGYLQHAYPYDELQPLTCAGHDTWGSYSLTLIDAMDTLAVMGNFSEFRRIAEILIDKGESFFDIDINVSVFETNIRIVGGLLSAHLLMKRAGMELEPAWPCSGPLLRMADNIARKILPAFDTATGMPYGTVNLRHGVPKGETTVTCTAGVGTFIVEFGALSRLTGDPIFEKTAIRAIRALWKYRSNLGLLGNHIDVSNGKWTALDSGIGGGIDSYFEYLVKGAVMFNIPEFLHMFREYEVAIKKYLKRDDWYMWAQMNKGTITLPLFTSLDGYWPSIKGMVGDLDEAMKTMHNFHQVWRQFGFTPEYYNIPKADVHSGREGYPLRPEIVESAMYLYRATKDPYLLQLGVDIVEAIEHSAKTHCGYATVKDVRDHQLEDRMESFFLAETTKYLYLLFDPDNFIHSNGSSGTLVQTPSGSCIIEAGGYIFNTEAHPIDLASVHCCSAAKKEEDRVLQDVHDNLDLLSLLDLVDEEDKNWHKSSSQTMRTQAPFEKDNMDSFSSGKVGEDYGDDDGVCKDEDAHIKFTSGDIDDAKPKTDGDLNQAFEATQHGREQSKKSHHLQLIDLSSFTEAERNLTRLFLENLKVDFILKNLSAQVADKLEQQFKETEYARLALGTAKKIQAALADLNISNDTDSSAPVTSDKSVSDDVNAAKVPDDSNKEEDEASSSSVVSMSSSGELSEDGSSNTKESTSGSATPTGEGDTQVKPKELVSLDPQVKVTITRSDGRQELVDQIQQRITELNGQQIIFVKADDKLADTVKDTVDAPDGDTASPESKNELSDSSGAISPIAERFKSHMDSQIQHVENQKMTQSSNSFSVNPEVTSLENKRTNLLSITVKLLQLFSRSSQDESKNGRTVTSRTPNLADLYFSLAHYPLTYFYDPSIMHCPAQPFHRRISVYGEMFPDD